MILEALVNTRIARSVDQQQIFRVQCDRPAIDRFDAATADGYQS
jgi:hypothetical protein